MKFTDIKTADQLSERVVDGILSVGNKLAVVTPFLTKIAPSAEAQAITVQYTAGSGKHNIKCYIKA